MLRLGYRQMQHTTLATPAQRPPLQDIVELHKVIFPPCLPLEHKFTHTFELRTNSDRARARRSVREHSCARPRKPAMAIAFLVNVSNPRIRIRE